MSSTEESIASEVIAASLGGALSASILYPLEVLKTKMQAASDDDKDKSMWEFATMLVKQYGARIFWVGVETSALQSATEKALYFFAYTALKRLYAGPPPHAPIRTLPNLTLGCLAEWAHLPITLPLDCWTTKIQTSTQNENGAMVLLCNMLSEKGIAGMYKGIGAYVVLCLKPAIQYTVFEQVKAMHLKGKSRSSLNPAESFLLGMVARTVATIVVFPYVRAKVVLQSSKEEQQSIVQVLRDMYSQVGVKAWFQGLGPELTRGVFSAALMLMMKEQIASSVHRALYGRRQEMKK